ncbi:universal stress protein [Blastococcus sp. PRF04-17]|uniref:universal stress protein n=1 Tax=Blastococcus sp. PRF04-17 TaxID=2933797 RepID=UPI001FF14EC2|nr:universal stress protein [Blastococcus sp. PRF04-17]UOX99888.1 universal stress protein [Blastococcus sp. PRF04-17]
MPTPIAPIAQPDAQEEDRPAGDDPPVREVVVGVDGSECGIGAAKWAAQEAERRSAPLRIVHAAPYLSRRGDTGEPPPELARARRITAQAYTAAIHTAPAVRSATEVVPGDPTTALLRAAAAGQLLVLGSSATGAADELVLASVAMKVAARSPQPVVVVPRRRTEPAGRPVVAVLGVGERGDDEAVADFAADEAQRRDVPLSVLQTRPARQVVPASWVDDPAEWERRYPGMQVDRTDLPGARANEVLGATCPSPLLVISAGHGDLLHRNLDGPHRWLLRHCTSPMALIPRVHRPELDPREEIIALG